MTIQTVAIRHTFGLCSKNGAAVRVFPGLSSIARARYKQKVVKTGLTADPYCIECWHEQLESHPEVNWSNMLTYMTETPSKNTCEAVKVNAFTCCRMFNVIVVC